MESLSDADVWEAVLAGQADGVGLIWDRHRDRVFRHLLGAGAAAQDAEDLTAITFLELWRRRASARMVEGSLLPWLLATASNVARNASRGRRRYQAFLAKLPEPTMVPDPADIVGAADDRADRLTQLLGMLGRRDRQLLVLTSVEGFSIAEAAAAVGLSEPAAKMRLSRLRKRLRISVDAHHLVEGEPA